MYIKDLAERASFIDNVKSTAQSFEHWDTCMANRTCKIVAIVGICLAGLFVLWLVFAFVQCLCLGATCIEALCCCCCGGCCRPKQQQVYAPPPQQPQPMYNPNMYPPDHRYNMQMREAQNPVYNKVPEPAYNGEYNSEYNGEYDREPVYRVVKM
ncbi:hypothetical protein DFJ63DRAFT_313241 [Scheffersomyces coipomensis]|uniref:uncharacterized protein n=1 Tax=Scheffersomyces coipomensis TaxID=1788519 RepID=UPI00315DDAFA